MKPAHFYLHKVTHLIAATIVLLSSSLAFPRISLAADFNIQIDRVFTVSEASNSIHIVETRTVRNLSSGYYIPKGSKETFTVQNFKEGFDTEEQLIKEQSIKVTNAKDQALAFTTSHSNNDILVEVTYPVGLTYGSSYSFKLQYDTRELREKVGRVTNIYIPGLSTSYQSVSTDPATNTTTQILYSTALEVPKSLGTPAFTLPAPISTSETTSTTTYLFSTDSLIGTSVWHQIGTQQTYFFRMTQKVPRSDTSTPSPLSFLSKVQYDLLLPRDYSETNQNVFFSKLEPRPDAVSIDSTGNAMATYYLDATKDSQILIEGYITVSVEGNTQDKSIAEAATLDQVRGDISLNDNLKSAQYWESDAPEIVAKAQELANGKTTILDILRADYSYIVQSINYDDFKYGDRNTRRGALATLKGGSSVCMEYSDLLIALARAQGIPARAAYGYGYDPKLPAGEQEEHQWVQAWIPGYGWLTIDPTWGETGRQFIGQDLDHALWYVASINPNLPSPLTVTAADTNFPLENSLIEITATDGIPTDITTQTLGEVTSSTGSNNDGSVGFLRTVQTSMMGRTLVIVLPVIALLIGLTIVAKLFDMLLKKVIRKNRTTVPTPQV